MSLPLFAFDTYNLLATLLVVYAVQIFFFAFAAIFKTDKLTDFVYGMTFVLVAAVFLLVSPSHPRVLLIAGAIILWGLRLAGYLFIRILKIRRDERFDGRREDFLKFAFFWLFQGAAIWFALLPLTFVASAPEQPPLGWLDAVGLGLWLIGLLIETVADQQKFSFRNDPQNKGRWIQSGLWRYSRFPNYFGEILLWWGLLVAALPALSGWGYAAVLGPLFIAWILLKVSGIPLLEESHEKKYGDDPEFVAYRARTSRLVPLPPGRA